MLDAACSDYYCKLAASSGFVRVGNHRQRYSIK